jgi:6-phosphofructokinase 1
VQGLLKHYGEQRDAVGFELRLTRLGHVVRGGVPTAADRVLATRLGAAAVDSLAAGKSGILLGMLRGEIAATSLAQIAGRTRPADAALCELAQMLAI